MLLRETATREVEPYDSRESVRPEQLPQKWDLDADHAGHSRISRVEGGLQLVRAREAVGRDEPPAQVVRPQPLVDEGVGVAEGQAGDGLLRRLFVLGGMDHGGQSFRAVLARDDELWLAGAARGHQDEVVVSVLGWDQRQRGDDPVLDEREVGRDEGECRRLLPESIKDMVVDPDVCLADDPHGARARRLVHREAR